MELTQQKAQQLSQKCKQLQSELESKDEQILKLEVIKQSADEKISALNQIHNEKIRSLMTSIQLLKKEQASLQKDTKEHKRSELIAKLNKDIGDQDLIIETLRKVINNEQKADQAIVNVLNKGPKRLRPPTREEMRMEVKKMTQQILVLQNQLKGGKKTNSTQLQQINQQQQQQQDTQGKQDEQDDMKSEVIEDGDGQRSEQQSFVRQDINDSLLEQIQILKQQNQDLRLSAKAEKLIIARQEGDLEQKHKELSELRSVKTDLQIIQKQKELLQLEYDKLKAVQQSSQLQGQDRDMRLEELEMLNQTQMARNDTLQRKVQQLERDAKEAVTMKTRLQNELDQLQSKTQALTVKLQREQNSSEVLKTNLETEINALQIEATQLRSAKEELEKRDRLVQQLQSEMARLEDRLQRTKQVQVQGKQESKGVQALSEENVLLREKVKEATLREIAVQDRLEDLQLELGLKKQQMLSNNVKHSLQQRSEDKIAELNRKIMLLQKLNEKLRQQAVDAMGDLDSNVSVRSDFINMQHQKSFQDMDSNFSGGTMPDKDGKSLSLNQMAAADNNSDISDIIPQNGIQHADYNEGDSNLSINGNGNVNGNGTNSKENKNSANNLQGRVLDVQNSKLKQQLTETTKREQYQGQQLSQLQKQINQQHLREGKYTPKQQQNQQKSIHEQALLEKSKQIVDLEQENSHLSESIKQHNENLNLLISPIENINQTMDLMMKQSQVTSQQQQQQQQDMSEFNVSHISKQQSTTGKKQDIKISKFDEPNNEKTFQKNKQIDDNDDYDQDFNSDLNDSGY